MGGSAAQTPGTPEYLRASDAERDLAIGALRQEFVEGRLSHDTFMFRVQSALGARHRGQLVGLFSDLPPRRPTLLDRIRSAFRRRDPDPDGAGADWRRASSGPAGVQAEPGMADAAGPPPRALWTGSHNGPQDAGQPGQMVFPPGSGTSFSIGRTQDCDLRIADLSVSRRHAQLDRGEDGWLLSDLDSHNGTRVNGWLVREPVPVRPGDLLQFGSAMFVIQGTEERAISEESKGDKVRGADNPPSQGSRECPPGDQ